MLTALIVGGLAMYSAAEIQDRQILDARLEMFGSTILALVEDHVQGAPKDLPASRYSLRSRPAGALLYRYQVWSVDGTLLLRSHEAPALQPLIEPSHFGFRTVRMDGEEYRAFALSSRDGRLVVQVAEGLDESVKQLGVLTLYYVGFLILPFGLILGATWLLLRRSLGSIRSITSQLTSRNPLDVTRVEVDRPPEEMLPILNSLEALFGRTRHAISVERRFTSVAAHEMRTPLAGLRAHAQLAVSSTNAEELREELAAVIQGVDGACHMLNQLLDIARIEGVARDTHQLTPVDLPAILDDVMGDLRTTIGKKSLTVTSDLKRDRINGLPMALKLIVRNLVANAVMYCPLEGRVHVSTFIESGDFSLVVDDSGPGIPEADRDNAFERFNRLGQRHIDGVGLGLSIVLMAVELHGARIALLDSPLGGLRCKVDFADVEGEAQAIFVPALDFAMR